MTKGVIELKHNLQGKYGKASVYAKVIDHATKVQIIELLNEEITDGNKVAIMPDTHAGKGSPVGTTIKIANDKVSPNVVGVDIGCGVMVTKIKPQRSFNQRELARLDQSVRSYIPAGFNVHSGNSRHRLVGDLLKDLTFDVGNDEHIHRSLGTLGGGNHFWELAHDEQTDSYYILVHSGSRNLGKQVAEHHQKQAIAAVKESMVNVGEIIERLKSEGRHKEIQSTIESFKTPHFNEHLAYLEGESLSNYLDDMNLAQMYAHENRKAMTLSVVKAMGFEVLDSFDSVHNYVDLSQMILRKGATDATKNMRLVIPINMRDGSILATGKGNADWNYSAPHGAGRIMSRREAKESITLDKMKDDMKDIYTTSVNESTLDEAPDAYKPIDAIVDVIGETVDINAVIKPIYNFKA